jgi:predicted secreted protein
MKRTLLAIAIASYFCLFFVNQGTAQVSQLKYQMRYNPTTCNYDCYIKIMAGTALTNADRAQFNAQYSIVTPKDYNLFVDSSFFPRKPDNSVTTWSITTTVPAPAIRPQSNFYSIVPTLSPTGFYPSLAPGTEYRLFSLRVVPKPGTNPPPNCTEGIRIFENPILILQPDETELWVGGDPPSTEPSMGQGDFSNGFTIGNPDQLYTGNLNKVLPPSPTVSSIVTCSAGIEIDLNATTFACQSPITYAWSGPNGFTSTTQDVKILPSSTVNSGLYQVTLTDKLGCKDTIDIQALSKPKAGSDIQACVGGSVTLTGTDPTTGTWSSSNPAVTVGATSAGVAQATIGADASGLINLIYTTSTCMDTVALNVSKPDGGADPAALICYLNGVASLNAVGTGRWSLASGNPGNATIASPTSPTTTIGSFSAAGTYTLLWTVGACADSVRIIVGEDCSCPVSNNTITPPPTSFCGAPTSLVLVGGTATPAGTYRWQVSVNSGAFANATGSSTSKDYTPTGLSNGSYSFRRLYTTTTGTICTDTSNTVSFTIAPTPGVLTNLTATPNPVCLGSAINLSVQNIPGAVYTWSLSSSNAGSTTSTTNTATITPTAAGIYTVSVTQTVAGCPSLPATISVTASNTPPTPADFGAADPGSCGATNGSITLTGLIPGQTYIFNYTKNNVPATANVTVNGLGQAVLSNLGAGSYTNIFLSNAAGCRSGVIDQTITLSEPNAPAAPTNIQAIPNPVCLGNVVNLSVTNNPQATYTWSAPVGAGLVLSTTNTTTMLATVAGSYIVSVTQTLEGCISTPASINVEIDPSPATPTAATVNASLPSACGTADGSISFSSLMPNANYTIDYLKNGVAVVANVVSNASGIAIISGLSSGTYSNFAITNIGLCKSGTYAGPVILSDPSAPSAPIVTAIPNPACLGTTVNLSASGVTGATYTWSFPANAGEANTVGNTSTMTPTTPGLYTVSVTQTTGSCLSVAGVVNVNIIPSPLTPLSSNITKADPTSCGGSQGSLTFMNLTPNTLYTINYTFNGVATSVNITTNAAGMAVVSNLGAGTYSNFSLSIGTCNSGVLENPIVLNEPNAPAAPTGLTANPNPVCAGARIALSAIGSTGATFTWSANSANAGLITSSTNATTMTPIVGGSYIISVSQAIGGCTSPTATIEVNVNPAPAAPIISIPATVLCIDEPVTVSVPSSNSIYNWTVSSSNAGLTSSSSNTVVLTPTATGTYTLSVTATSDICTSPPATVTFTVRNCSNPDIGDFVWNDVNANGIQNAGEPGLPNITVKLFRSDDLLYAQTTTSATGAYKFSQVEPGFYYLAFSGTTLEPTFPNQGGNDNLDSDLTGLKGAGTTAEFEVIAGVENLTLDAGFYQCNKIGNLVWYDLNKNDVWDNTENGINGLTVNLFRNVGGQWSLYDKVKTGQKPGSPSDDGHFEFCAPAGTYYVQVVMPPYGLVTARPNIGGNRFKDSDITGANGVGSTNTFTVIAGQDKLDIGAGYYPMATAGNLVWLDNNVNGIQDSNEPRVEGVLVEAFDESSNALVGSAMTNSEGVYKIDYLNATDIYYKFTPPTGYSPTIHIGLDDKSNSDVDHSYGVNTTRAIKMASGVDNVNIDLGLAFGVLPVTWESVKATRVDNNHVVEWKTSMEVNVDYFQVERIAPGGKEFEIVSEKIRANNNSLVSNMYLFTDKDVSDNGVYFYKVRQVDFDGQMSYSEIVNVDFDKEGGYLKAYPNPTTQLITLEVNLKEKTKVNVEIHNLNGQKLNGFDSSHNLGTGQHSLPIDLKQLPAGVYYILVEYNGIQLKKEIIKG